MRLPMRPLMPLLLLSQSGESAARSQASPRHRRAVTICVEAEEAVGIYIASQGYLLVTLCSDYVRHLHRSCPLRPRAFHCT